METNVHPNHPQAWTAKQRLTVIVMVFIVILAAGIHLYHLGMPDFWVDEFRYVTLKDGYAYVTACRMLHIVDIDDPTKPVRIGARELQIAPVLLRALIRLRNETLFHL